MPDWVAEMNSLRQQLGVTVEQSSRLEDALRLNSERLSFANSLVHDVNNQLLAIHFSCIQLLAKLSADDMNRSTVVAIEEARTRAAKLIREFQNNEYRPSPNDEVASPGEPNKEVPSAAATTTKAPLAHAGDLAFAGAGSETILLVEDEVSLRKLMKTVFESHGYQVIEAPNSQIAMMAAQAHPRPQLLVTDLNLPGLSGHALAEQFWLSNPDLPVLFISGSAYDDSFANELSGARVSFVKKPFKTSHLLSKVREILDESRQSR